MSLNFGHFNGGEWWDIGCEQTHLREIGENFGGGAASVFSLLYTVQILMMW